MLTMGAGTVGIGLIPPYHVIGPVSAFLLVACRLLQGLGVGGEWGGANLLAMESGSPRRRGFLTSFPQAGAMLGLASANLAVLVMTTVLPGDEFVRWGWRPIALYIAVAGMVGLAAVITLQRRNAAMTTLVDRTPGLQAGAVVDDDEWPKVSFTAAC